MQTKYRARLAAFADEPAGLEEAPRPIQLRVRVQQDQAFRLRQLAIDLKPPVGPRSDVVRSKDAGARHDFVDRPNERFCLLLKHLLVAEKHLAHGSTYLKVTPVL